MKGIVNCAAYSKGQRAACIELTDIHEVLKDCSQFVWLGLYEPSEDLLMQVQKEFGLHHLAIEDAHRAHQRPKIEQYGDSLFIVLRTVQMNQEHCIHFGETHFFVGHNFIVTVRHGPSLPYTDVRMRCETMPELMGKGHGFVLYAIMDFIVDQYFPVVEDLGMQLETVEDLVFKGKPSHTTAEQIYQLKKELLEVNRAVFPLIDICNRLMRFDMTCISQQTQPYFRDIYDHAMRITEMVDNTRELLNTALDANFSLISISQNDISKKFAAWAAILAVPTLATGIYGMNFKFMPGQESHLGFLIVVISSLVICVVMYLYFRRSNWL